MSGVVVHEPNAEDSDDADESKSRVTPVMPPPNWLRELDDDAPTWKPPKAVSEEAVFLDLVINPRGVKI